jgi:hypothetical protein
MDAYALTPAELERSVAITRDTVGRPAMKILSLVTEVEALTGGAPAAIVVGLAQMLWARKTFTEDIDLALASVDLEQALESVTRGEAPPGWALPSPPDASHEGNDVFEVAHLLYDGVVVDLLSFREAAFTKAIIATAVRVPQLGNVAFITPELLLVTQLLRPGTRGAIAALELVLARRQAGGIDLAQVRHFAELTHSTPRLERVLAQVDALEAT